MHVTIGFSPCPNDTFIFDALVNKKIDTEGFDFDVLLEDVQTLNEWALEGKLNFSKISSIFKYTTFIQYRDKNNCLQTQFVPFELIYL